MKKIILFLFAFVCLMFAFGGLSADNVNYNDDGSVDIVDESGKSNHFKMEGFTAYGQKIEEVCEIVRRENFLFELVYSASLSDDILDGEVKQLYENILTAVHARVLKFPEGKVPVERLKIVISNCRFGKSGYCRRKNVREISLIIYKNEKKKDEKKFIHNNIRRSSMDVALEITNELFE